MPRSGSTNVSRRHFVQTTGTAAVAGAWPASRCVRVIRANDRIRTGFIGVGGMSDVHLDAMNASRTKEIVEAVAVCMANESWRTGQRMRWDTKQERMVPANTLPSTQPSEKKEDA
jgi:hypothetical protein